MRGNRCPYRQREKRSHTAKSRFTRPRDVTFFTPPSSSRKVEGLASVQSRVRLLSIYSPSRRGIARRRDAGRGSPGLRKDGECRELRFHPRASSNVCPFFRDTSIILSAQSAGYSKKVPLALGRIGPISKDLLKTKQICSRERSG